ncbi:hypothetical protein VSDG_02016 [Cytospora chrysosperma]|uniref:Uncharacterized protein n=1 Tax=Cytospora chrysosperma TaxID=252740 RepID=A0A423WEK7_CYTCH|nr:hypothetical protein VSDG_02016 [Valsa sordida]
MYERQMFAKRRGTAAGPAVVLVRVRLDPLPLAHGRHHLLVFPSRVVCLVEVSPRAVGAGTTLGLVTPGPVAVAVVIIINILILILARRPEPVTPLQPAGAGLGHGRDGDAEQADKGALPGPLLGLERQDGVDAEGAPGHPGPARRQGLLQLRRPREREQGDAAAHGPHHHEAELGHPEEHAAPLAELHVPVGGLVVRVPVLEHARLGGRGRSRVSLDTARKEGEKEPGTDLSPFQDPKSPARGKKGTQLKEASDLLMTDSATVGLAEAEHLDILLVEPQEADVPQQVLGVPEAGLLPELGERERGAQPLGAAGGGPGPREVDHGPGRGEGGVVGARVGHHGDGQVDGPGAEVLAVVRVQHRVQDLAGKQRRRQRVPVARHAARRQPVPLPADVGGPEVGDPALVQLRGRVVPDLGHALGDVQPGAAARLGPVDRLARVQPDGRVDRVGRQQLRVHDGQDIPAPHCRVPPPGWGLHVVWRDPDGLPPDLPDVDDVEIAIDIDARDAVGVALGILTERNARDVRRLHAQGQHDPPGTLPCLEPALEPCDPGFRLRLCYKNPVKAHCSPSFRKLGEVGGPV